MLEVKTTLVPGVAWPEYTPPRKAVPTKYDLSEKGRRILECIENNPGSTTPELAVLLEMNKSTLGKNICYYSNCGKIVGELIPNSVGNTKRWYIVKNKR